MAGPVAALAASVVAHTGPSAPPRIEPAPRAHPVPFKDYWHDGDRYVVPGDAAKLVHDGVLDRELFNVTGLVRQRYDDAHTDAVPLLVEYTGARARTEVPEVASVRRALPELGLTALDQGVPQVGAPTAWDRRGRGRARARRTAPPGHCPQWSPRSGPSAPRRPGRARHCRC